MQPAWIAVVISSIALIGGIVSHYFVVIKTLVEVKTRLKAAESDIVALKRHLPVMEARINETHAIVSRMDGKFEIFIDSVKRK